MAAGSSAQEIIPAPKPPPPAILTTGTSSGKKSLLEVMDEQMNETHTSSTKISKVNKVSKTSKTSEFIEEQMVSTSQNNAFSAPPPRPVVEEVFVPIVKKDVESAPPPNLFAEIEEQMMNAKKRTDVESSTHVSAFEEMFSSTNNSQVHSSQTAVKTQSALVAGESEMRPIAPAPTMPTNAVKVV